MKNHKFWLKILRVFIVLLLSSSLCLAQSNNVRIKGKRRYWYLEVNGKRLYIKGVGCGLAKGKKGQDYLKLAKELGANTVRTWGTDQGTKQYLDQAYKYGLYVCAGIWFNFVDDKGWPSYIGNSKYKKRKEREVLDYVNSFKDHPSILLWNVGNETIYWTKDPKQRIAIARFLEELVQKIHKIDPNHPVLYSCACDYQELKIIKEHVPSLDIVGINSYGSIRFSQGKWDYLGFNIPYIITEFGPYGPWDRPKDINGVSIEQTDREKALLYKYYLREIQEFKGYNLGAFAFHLGETTQESMTWWNINEGNSKRESFWVIHDIYTRKKTKRNLPRIKRFTLSKYRGIRPEEFIEVFVEPEGKNLKYSYKISTAFEGILRYYVNEWVETEIQGQGNKVKIKAPKKEGLYRVYCFLRDRKGNITTFNRSIKVDGK